MIVMHNVQRLPKEILERPEFESYFVGAESKIDQVLSSTWLKQHTKHWTWKNYIMANTPRCAFLPKYLPRCLPNAQMSPWLYYYLVCGYSTDFWKKSASARI